jgi:hypothetical protein
MNATKDEPVQFKRFLDMAQEVVADGVESTFEVEINAIVGYISIGEAKKKCT